MKNKILVESGLSLSLMFKKNMNGFLSCWKSEGNIKNLATQIKIVK